MSKHRSLLMWAFAIVTGLLLGLALIPRAALATETANGIPVVTIDLTCEDGETPEEAFAAINESPDHSVSRAATLTIAVPDGYTGDYSDVPLADQGPLEVEYIRGRGNSTWIANKKSYKIKLKSGTNLLSMGKNKHWALLANPFDPSLIRNRLVSYMGTALGLDYTPQMLPVDLVVDGVYIGSYFLAETVRIGNSRVEIDELTAQDNAEPEVTGGYLFSLSPYQNENAANRIITNGGVYFGAEDPVFYSDDPSDDVGTQAQRSYLASYLQALEDAIYGGGDWQALMDEQSTARYWWIQEFTLNSDAYCTPSSYLYKPREGKVYWGPLWDFDSSMRTFQDEELGQDVAGFNNSSMEWLDYLRTYDSDYQARLKEAWAEYDAILDEIVRERGVLDRYYAEMLASWNANYALWGEDGASEQPTTFAAEIEQLRDWITRRRAWVNEHIDTELTRVLCRLSFEADGACVATEYVRVGENCRSSVDWPYKEGKVFMGWMLPDGSFWDVDTVFEEDTVLVATYADIDDVVAAEAMYFLRYEYWVCVDDAFGQLSGTVTPYDTDERYFRWTSSNPEVATVDSAGMVTYVGVGDTTITVALANGASTSVVLHVVGSYEELVEDATSMTLAQDTITLEPDGYAQIPLSFEPDGLGMYAVFLRFELSDETVAEVDKNAVVHALSLGTTTITVWCGFNDEVEPVTVTVVVEDEGTDPGTDPGEDPGTDPGEDPGVGPGVDPGADPGTGPGVDPGADPGAGPSVDPGADPSKGALSEQQANAASDASKASGTSKPSSEKLPNAGDESAPAVAFMLAALACLGVASSLLKKGSAS